ncbi:MAG TPA: transcriptional regulator, partial [Sporolactobacillaceae bacterium]|nr:transcriptional regulator [Sporolactobacillaceae bacterium]
MIEQIKSLYGQAFISETSNIQNPEAFYWFKTEAGIPFGLRRSAITDKEYQLLCLSFQAIN